MNNISAVAKYRRGSMQRRDATITEQMFELSEMTKSQRKQYQVYRTTLIGEFTRLRDPLAHQRS